MSAPAVERATTTQHDLSDEDVRQAVEIAKGLREVAAAAKNYKEGEYTLGLRVSKDGAVVFTVTRQGWL